MGVTITGFIPQFVINSLCVQSHLLAEGREIISHYNKLEFHVNLSCITTHSASPMFPARTPCAIILLLSLYTHRLFFKFGWHTHIFHFYLSISIFSLKGKKKEQEGWRRGVRTVPGEIAELSFSGLSTFPAWLHQDSQAPDLKLD